MSQPSAPGVPDPELIDDIVAANRILADQGVMSAYGHVSGRDRKNPQRYWLSRSRPPALITPEDIREYDIDSNPIVADNTKHYEERAIHGEIYRARPDVNCVIHNHCPSLIPFANTDTKLRPMTGNAGFLRHGPPVFDIRDVDDTGDLNVCTAEQGRGLAAALGDHTVCLMRGHGVVVVGDSVREAVRYAVVCDVNARLILDASRLGGAIRYLTESEIAWSTGKRTRDPNRGWTLWKTRAFRDG
jgi:HCOMODA/2-hydroxy-3-carboxy-muconic semialdehyde decarboxylase